MYILVVECSCIVFIQWFAIYAGLFESIFPNHGGRCFLFLYSYAVYLPHPNYSKHKLLDVFLCCYCYSDFFFYSWSFFTISCMLFNKLSEWIVIKLTINCTLRFDVFICFIWNIFFLSYIGMHIPHQTETYWPILSMPSLLSPIFIRRFEVFQLTQKFIHL